VHPLVKIEDFDLGVFTVHSEVSYYNLLSLQSYILSYKAKGEDAPEDMKVAVAEPFVSNLTLDAIWCSAL
jgi:hypothetical protein